MMKDERKTNDANRDPVTGEPGSHPVGTAVGAAAGGVGGAAAGAAAGAAIGTGTAGPVGTAVGAVAGALVGAAAGHGAAEGLNPTTASDEGRYIGYTVVDTNNEKVGTVESVWLDAGGDPAYLAVRTGWLGMGRTYVVPAQSAHVSARRQEIRLPYLIDQVKSAPEFDSSVQLMPQDEDRITGYYGGHGFRREGWLSGTAGEPMERKLAESGEKSLRLKEEQLHVGKREVEYGGVRLRKVVRTEVVNQPIELQREEIVIERVPASDTTSVTDTDFSDEEIYVPLRREEAVVAKEAHVREEVRVGKRQEREQQTVSETVRKEDIEVENISESHGFQPPETGRELPGTSRRNAAVRKR